MICNGDLGPVQKKSQTKIAEICSECFILFHLALSCFIVLRLMDSKNIFWTQCSGEGCVRAGSPDGAVQWV